MTGRNRNGMPRSRTMNQACRSTLRTASKRFQVGRLFLAGRQHASAMADRNVCPTKRLEASFGADIVEVAKMIFDADVVEHAA